MLQLIGFRDHMFTKAFERKRDFRRHAVGSERLRSLDITPRYDVRFQGEADKEDFILIGRTSVASAA